MLLWLTNPHISFNNWTKWIFFYILKKNAKCQSKHYLQQVCNCMLTTTASIKPKMIRNKFASDKFMNRVSKFTKN